MNPALASALFICGIVGLFYLDRDKTGGTSRALWLPTLWVAICGSRSVSTWLGMNTGNTGEQLQGSPVDAACFGLLSIFAIAVLVQRSQRTRKLLLANWPILFYFIYCLVSVLWSDHPNIAFKRWIKAIGDLAMVLVIATERQPIVAMQRVISHVGFVLLPASVLFIKYFDYIGRGYTPDGATMNTGVSTDKNMLGVMLLVISLGTFWHVLTLYRAKHLPDRKRHLIAQIVLLMFGVALLKMANSQTSLASFLLGCTIIFITSLRSFRLHPKRIHALCLAIVLGGGLLLLGGGGTDVVHALGRKSSLSGRTDIWAALIPAAENPIVGSGYESFWISPSVVKFQRALVGWYHPEDLNEAHDGYLEMYLNLGWIGVAIIALVLATGYRRAVMAYRRNAAVGNLLLAYVVAAMVYNITEAGFRMLDCIWIFLLLAIVVSSAVAIGLCAPDPRILRAAPKGASSPRVANPVYLPSESV